MNRIWAFVLAAALAQGLVRAQTFPPGYVDPQPLLAAAAKEIGEANLRCITFSGTGYSGAVGQTFEYAVNVDWPRIDAMANYTRTINWETGTSKETFDRKPGLNPASWKYGLGWRGGTPIQKQLRQTHVVNGIHAWSVDGEGGTPVAASPEDAERYQLDLWLTWAGCNRRGLYRCTAERMAQQPGGDVFHGGGQHWTTKDDPDWQVLAAWVNGATMAGAANERIR